MMTSSIHAAADVTCPASFLFADKTNSLVFMITAFISLTASYVTMRECVADFKIKKYEQAMPLLIFSLNVGYFFFFFGKIFGPLPGPKQLSVCAWGTMGTTQTCTAQSFFIQVGVWALAYHLVALVWSYVAIIKYGWRERHLIKAVKWGISVIWVVTFAMANAGLWLKVYNFKDQNCYISVYPPGCLKTGNCIRGGNAAYIFGWIVKAPYFPFVAIMCTFFCIVFLEVRKVEEKISRYASCNVHFTSSTSAQSDIGMTPGDNNGSCELTPEAAINSSASTDQAASFSFSRKINRKKSHAVAVQAILLAGWNAILVLLLMFEMFAPKFFGYQNYNLHIVKTVFDNLQGLIFFVIFALPRVSVMRTREGRFLRNIIFCNALRQHLLVTKTANEESNEGAKGDVNHTSGVQSSNNAEASDSTRADITTVIDEASREEKDIEAPSLVSEKEDKSEEY